MTNELSLNELDHVNGWFFMLLFYAIASKPANAPAPGGETYKTAGEETVLDTMKKVYNGVVADENGKGCTDRFPL